MALSVQVHGKTDVGCVRTNNEDNFGYDSRYGIYVVCDGMGGAAAGEVASKMGVDTVLDYFRRAAQNGAGWPPFGKPFEGVSARGQALASAIQLANQVVHEAGAQHAARAGMGSTIVAVLVQDGFFSIGHVGDSRIYLVRGGEIQQLTDDHSLVMEQVRHGLITREEAEHSEVQNIIIRNLGSEETVQPDIDDLVAMEGDVLVLASDGLTKHVPGEMIKMIVESASTLEQATDEMIGAAKDHGGDDNITCVLLKMVEQSWYQSLMKRLFGGGKQWQSST